MHTHGIDLERGRRFGHDNDCPTAQSFGSQGNSLGMVAGGTTDDTLLQLVVAQVRHFVVSATNLEGKDILCVFAFQIYMVLKYLKR
jgi:hypothetical protein